MNSDREERTDKETMQVGQSKHDESQIQLKTKEELQELEVYLDSGLKQKVKLLVTPQAIEIAQAGRARTALGLDLFMGVQLVGAKDVEKPGALAAPPSLVILQGRMHKKLVVVDRHTFFGTSAESLAAFREACLSAYYRLVDPQTQVAGSPKKRLLFFVSPKSGKGTGLKIYDEQKQYFEALDIQCVKVVTDRRNHARDYVRDVPAEEFRKFDGVVTIGGDGIPHEVVNGFCSRQDYKQLKLVLGLLPGGSGCALLFNMLSERKLEFDALSATYLLTRWALKKKSVFRFLFKPTNQEGFFADVDFGSEKFRCLGNLRFDCYGALTCCCPGGQQAEISWKRKLGADRGLGTFKANESATGSLAAPLLDKEAADPETEETKTRSLKENIYFMNMNMHEYMSRDMKVAPELTMESDQAAMTIMPKKSGWCKFLCFLLNFGSGKFTEKPKEHGVIHENIQSLRIKLLPPNAKKGDFKVVVGVDGERYEATEVEAQLVLDNTVFFMC